MLLEPFTEGNTMSRTLRMRLTTQTKRKKSNKSFGADRKKTAPAEKYVMLLTAPRGTVYEL